MAPTSAKVTLNSDCDLLILDDPFMACEVTVRGDSTDNGQQVIVQLLHKTGTVIQSKECVIEPFFDLKTTGYKCTVNFALSLVVFKNVDSIVAIDKNTSEVLYQTSLTVSGKNPCGTECETALGNIPTDAGAFAGKILSIATGLAGGIAFILMVIGAIRVLTSTGNPQNVNAGRDMIVAAVAGLLFLIFSVLILRFIGVEILDLSG